MGDKRHRLRRKIAGFILFVSLLSGGVYLYQNSDIIVKSNLLIDYFHSHPLFLRDATPVDSHTSIYSFSPLAFSGKPYNNIVRFGDNILLIGEGYKGEESLGEEFLDEFAEENPFGNLNSDSSESSSSHSNSSPDVPQNFQYQFDVYSPWVNSIMATLLPNEIHCDSYQVAGDHLLLLDSTQHSLVVCDDRLTFIANWDTNLLETSSNMQFFGFDGCEAFYTTSTNGQLLKVVPSEDCYQITTIDLPYYNVDLRSADSSTHTLLFHAVDAKTLQYVSVSFCPDTNETLATYQSPAYFYGGTERGLTAMETDSTYDTWSFYPKNASPLYFPCSNFHSVHFSDENCMSLLTYTDANCGTIQFGNYDDMGNCLASANYTIADQEQEKQYLSLNSVYLPDANCIFLLEYDNTCHSRFLIWDMTKSEEAPSLSMSVSNDAVIQKEPPTIVLDDGSIYGNTVNALTDSKHYDWGVLTPQRAYADELEEKYEIEIYIGEQVPSRVDIFYAEQETSPEYIQETLERLDSLFASYPPDFLTQLQYGELQKLRIYLSGELSGSGDTISAAAGFVNHINNHLIMVLDCSYNWNLEYTVSHELCHLIDRKLEFWKTYQPDAIFSENTWNSFNPEGFSYLETYANYEHAKRFQKDYFIDSYGITFATEDRAEIFGTAMSQVLTGSQDDTYFTEGSVFSQKLAYYSTCIRACFDTTNWPEELPWESIFTAP